MSTRTFCWCDECGARSSKAAGDDRCPCGGTFWSDRLNHKEVDRRLKALIDRLEREDGPMPPETEAVDPEIEAVVE